jgi:hypothetical protein
LHRRENESVTAVGVKENENETAVKTKLSKRWWPAGGQKERRNETHVVMPAQSTGFESSNLAFHV